jgi:hypothetical protein
MAGIYRCNSIKEAVLKAREFKENGKYDYFRGQQECWPLVSTFCRLPLEEQKKAVVNFSNLIEWSYTHKNLRDVIKTDDEFIAIAQHYGMPTNFIDFTRSAEVAGFFASSQESSSNKESCILCLDSKDLFDFMQDFDDVTFKPELLELNVPNLWRLESQQGVFLQSNYTNFEHIYDFDRIIFPSGSLENQINKNEIYPNRKSQLEILLDKYFMQSKLDEDHRIVIEGHNSWSVISVEFNGLDDFKPDPDVFKNDEWSLNDTGNWLQHQVESYDCTVNVKGLTLYNSVFSSSGNSFSSLESYFCNILNSSKNIRNTACNWMFEENKRNGFTEFLNRLWDGVRLLPYSNEVIAYSMASLVVLLEGYLEWDSPYIKQPTDYINSLDKNWMEVEFGMDENAYSRGYIPEDKLLSALRQNIDSCFHSKAGGLVSQSGVRLLQVSNTPNHIFNFSYFSEIFCRYIIPTQVFCRGKKSAVYYNPALLDSFGLP